MKDYSKEYLEGLYGAIHVIKHIIDWDEVWNEIERKEYSEIDNA